MKETWKKRSRAGLRVIEVTVAVALLAILVELVLVLRSSPGPMQEIRIVRVERPAEDVPPAVLVPAEMPPAPDAQEKKAAQAPPAPRRPVPPALLDFENLRRLLGVAKPAPIRVSPGGGGSGDDAPSAGGSHSMLIPLVISVSPVIMGVTNIVTGTNSLPGTNNVVQATNSAPAQGAVVATNQVPKEAVKRGVNNDPQVFRISVP